MESTKKADRVLKVLYHNLYQAYQSYKHLLSLSFIVTVT